MKNRSYILLILVMTHLQGEAQDDPEERQVACLGDYKLRVETPIYECNITGMVTDSILMVAEPGSMFTVVNVTEGDSLVIRFWEWKENNALNSRLCYADSLQSRRKYFIVARKDIAGRVAQRFNRDPGFTAGSVLIPFKLRVKNFDFSKDITLGPAAGVRFRLSHFSPDFVNIIAGVGITSVTIDGYIKDGLVVESIEVPALTPFIGFVFELNKAIQTGMFCGWDYVAHNDKINFIYHGKTWISIGLGYSLVSFNEERPEFNEKKKP